MAQSTRRRFSHDQIVTLFAIALLCAAGLLTTSCSKKAADHSGDFGDSSKKSAQGLAEQDSEKKDENSAGGDEDGDDENKPDAGDVGEDCVSFVQATRSAVAGPEGACPTCPTGGESVQVLKFDDVKIDRMVPSGATCQVTVRIFASFSPSHGGAITGGLTGWIPAELRDKYSRGETPAGEQVYKVEITYRRNPNGWQPIDFSQGSKP